MADDKSGNLFVPLKQDEPSRTVHYEVERQQSNTETGEVLGSENKTVVSRQPQTPDFTMVFTQDLGYLKNISGGASKLLFGLIKIVDRNNEATLNSSRKKMIADETGLKLNSIDTLLTQLTKKEVIERIDRGIYRLNPFIFGKGSWKNIRSLRMMVEYDFTSGKKRMLTEIDSDSDGDEFGEIPYSENPQLAHSELDKGSDARVESSPESENTDRKKVLDQLGSLDDDTIAKLGALLNN